jgi:hypothetical protein
MNHVMINDAELQALMGLRWDARILYLMELRPHMDIRTGVVGLKRGICLRGLLETLYVEPMQGRGRRNSELPEATIKVVRGALAELERAGLIVRKPSEKLVFSLVLASKTEVRPKADGQMMGRGDGQVFSAQGCGFAVDDGQGLCAPDGHTSEIGDKTDIFDQSSSSAAHTVLAGSALRDDDVSFDDLPVVPNRADQWVVVFQRLGFPLHLLKTPKLMPHFVDWVGLGVSVPLVLRAVAHGRANGEPATPLYFVPIVRQFWQAQAAGESPRGSARSSRSAAGGGRGGRGSRIPAEDAVWAASLLS